MISSTLSFVSQWRTSLSDGGWNQSATRAKFPKSTLIPHQLIYWYNHLNELKIDVSAWLAVSREMIGPPHDTSGNVSAACYFDDADGVVTTQCINHAGPEGRLYITGGCLNSKPRAPLKSYTRCENLLSFHLILKLGFRRKALWDLSRNLDISFVHRSYAEIIINAWEIHCTSAHQISYTGSNIYRHFQLQPLVILLLSSRTIQEINHHLNDIQADGSPFSILSLATF
jgi:hypothetical protein